MIDPALLVNFVDPPVLFFFFGLVVVLLRSNLEIPTPIAKALSLYLLLAIGFKGGVSLAASGVTTTMILALVGAMLMALAVPAWSWFILRSRISPFDAAAIAATYGSVSVVTFIAATSLLNTLGTPYGGYMTVALVLMESPAVVMAVLLANLARRRAAAPGPQPVGAAVAPAMETTPDGTSVRLGPILHEAFTDGALVLLLGSMAVGFIAAAFGATAAPMAGFIDGDVFKGVLAFFLLDMGIQVGHRLRRARDLSLGLVAFAVVMPVVNATAGGAVAYLFGLPLGDALLLAVLAASGSYIVVPAVVRYAIPEANPGRYFTMSLAITFPFNLAIGIPLYHLVLSWVWGA